MGRLISVSNTLSLPYLTLQTNILDKLILCHPVVRRCSKMNTFECSKYSVSYWRIRKSIIHTLEISRNPVRVDQDRLQENTITLYWYTHDFTSDKPVIKTFFRNSLVDSNFAFKLEELHVQVRIDGLILANRRVNLVNIIKLVLIKCK